MQAAPLESAYGALDNQVPVLRTLGVEKATNHTAQQQFNGWINVLDTCCDLLNRSPLGRSSHLSSRSIALKLRGVLTDHAADQKRLLELIRAWKQSCDRQVRAVPALKLMSTEQQLHALSEYLDNAAGSVSDWRALPEDQQSMLMHDAWLALATQIGDEEFQKLDQNTQFEADFVAWTGCCMHKELNAVKGGVAAMATAWNSLGSGKPIALRNKFEATAELSAVQNKVVGGAVKLTSLAGALFNHKDDKRGYQSSVDYYFEVCANQT